MYQPIVDRILEFAAQGGYVPGPGEGGVPGPRGVYLVLGGCTWSGGVPGPGGCTWSRGVVPGPGGCTWSWGMYLVWGVYLVRGEGVVPGPGGVVFLVPGGYLVLGGCTWCQGGVPGPREGYLVLGGVPGQVLPP